MMRKKMKIVVLVMLVLGLIISISCCRGMFTDEELTLQREVYIGNELKIDGYYYYIVPESNRTVIWFFYRNGVVLHGGTYMSVDFDEIEAEMVRWYSEKRKIKGSWGVFLIDGDKIQIETWAEAPNGVSLATFRRSGNIINDTTIHITETYYSGRNETKQVDKVWHYKQFDNKPDSTNTFIK